MPTMTWHLRLLLALAGGFLLAGCAGRETAVQSGSRQQVLHRGIGVEPSDLDPHLATATNDFHTISALFEGLVGQDPTDLSPVPGVAERWETSADARTYTFHLRANARWSNGDPVTAQDFVASYRRMLSASLAADNANLLYVLQGAEAFHKGGTTDFGTVGATALDERTLRLTLEHPTPYFMSLLQHWAWYPVHLPTIEQSGAAAVRGNPWARVGTLVGNGPFVLTEWRPNQRIIVTKSPTYWDAATVRLQAIHLYPIDSRDAEERAFRAGQLHVTEALPAGKAETYRRDRPEVLRIDPYLGTEFYRINVTRPFLNEKRVRRALALAVDRRAIVDRILQGGQEPAAAFTPPGTAGYRSPASLPTDIAEARRLLAEAGYPGGIGAPSIELTFNTSETHRIVAEAVQEMWRRELGLEVRLVNQELRSVLAARRTGDFQILRSVWIGDYADPSTFLNLWRSDSGNNYTGWASPAYDQLTFQAARTSDTNARHALLARAEALLLEDAPLIPIYHYTHVFLVHPDVKGWQPTLLDHHPYKHVWLEP
jgi:oligopeptide transport system substrate-binding protein